MRLIEILLQFIEAEKIPGNMGCKEALRKYFQSLIQEENFLGIPEDVLKKVFEMSPEEIMKQILAFTTAQICNRTASTLCTIAEVTKDDMESSDLHIADRQPQNYRVMLTIIVKAPNRKTLHIGKELEENEPFCLNNQNYLEMVSDSSLLMLNVKDRKLYVEEQSRNEKNPLAFEVNKENVKEGEMYMVGTKTIRIKTITPENVRTEVNGVFKVFNQKVNVLDEETGTFLTYKSKWWVIECAKHPIQHIVEQGKSVFISPDTQLAYKGFKIVIRY